MREDQGPPVQNSFEVSVPEIVVVPDYQFAERLYQGILGGLDRLGIELLPDDASVLKTQVFKQVHDTKRIETELRWVAPHAILVHSDNHPPYQNYVMVARRHGIPSIMLQHGLDCEHYCLDDAYASCIAVWSMARLHRYELNSSRFPDLIRVTGNPDFEALCVPQEPRPAGDSWLWLTRPHAPHKCYSPSRRPQEGMEILESLLGALAINPSARLVIKPHPFDYADLYQERIQRSPVAGRAHISTDDVRRLIPNACVVISEDTTAGLEAMFWSKVIVHAHFAESRPVLPLTDYGAALPGFTPDMLQHSLQWAKELSGEDRQKMLNGQRAFLRDYAGGCQKGTSKRLVSFVLKALKTNGRALRLRRLWVRVRLKRLSHQRARLCI